METRVGGELRPQRLDRIEQLPRIFRTAQARLPRPGRAMEDGGDAVGDRLPIAVDQCHVGREVDAWARHHLPLERIAVQIDDAGQHQEAAGIDMKRGAPLFGVERADVAARGAQRGLYECTVNQRAPALDENVRHDVALRCFAFD
ncbi:hypothetical protein chiPu_0033520 [Chiloscyllium punctatum]|uniref:Uncharacterized protein n=1 Tax=Chiloscyllium punctatum TaxID=137246 RepID=A0A401U3D9_CHIPU|nr:hypothetical protein [Chiloscyllium punctatum]